MINIGDEKQVKKREKKIESRDERYMDDLRNVMNHASGRRVLWKILEYCGPMRNCFIEDSQRMTDFLLGQKNLGLKLMDDIERVNPEFYVRMRKEQDQGDNDDV
jgi:hypothetical protein